VCKAGIDDFAHCLCGVVCNRLALDAAVFVEARIPIAIVIGVAVRRIGEHHVNRFRRKRRQNLPAVTAIEGNTFGQMFDLWSHDRSLT
jgi:hypothetical protein